MTIAPKIELRQSQTLVMTPQLQQAIKLLQFSTFELREFIEAELSENPLLDRDDGDNLADSQMVEDHGASLGTKNEDFNESEGLETLDLKHQQDFSKDQVDSLDMEEYDNIWERDTNLKQSSNESSFSLPSPGNQLYRYDQDSYGIEQTLSQNVSLRDYLINQIKIEFRNPKERLIAVFLVDNLDNYGRISEEIDELAKRLGCQTAKLKQVLFKLQKFDPPGIFARNLSECWEIQLRELNRLDPAMKTLLKNIDILKAHDYETLTKLCNVNYEDIQDMINEVWALSHNPTDSFDDSTVQPVSADILMRPGAEGTWILELNTAELPKVLVNNDYYAEINTNVRTKEEKKYLVDKLQWANWLVKSLHQRAITILKVATEIVSLQEDFFTNGVEHLRPMALRDVAERIEMHESTVSRVTSNKYIDTPRGIFELKYFFSTAIQSSKGERNLSSESVKFKIKSFIDQEGRQSILSDDKLVQLLKLEGIEVARRTVAKYREGMGILSSIQRRKLKNNILPVK